ncbi:protein takeout-like [Copidosoma floridanum]|uniref:protein takeout-like n=1 Tax=Copidosoma floridanum TaxID=29053 RepID=UPI000C6FC400|nr:protein takeout-like [Copidosoma floridanum]
MTRSFKICKRDTPDYSSCLRLAIQETWMPIIKGIPELGLPVMDPYYIDFMEHEYESGDIAGRLVLRNTTTYGLAKTRFLAVRPSFTGDRVNLEVDIEIPKVFIDGFYKAEGAIGPYKIGGKGYFNVSMEGISATWGIEGRVNEYDRLVVEHFHVFPEVESMKVYFTDLFNGDEALNKMALTFVNEYWQVIYKSMLPIVEKEWDHHLAYFVNDKFFSKIPASKLFP